MQCRHKQFQELAEAYNSLINVEKYYTVNYILFEIYDLFKSRMFSKSNLYKDRVNERYHTNEVKSRTLYNITACKLLIRCLGLTPN